MRQRRFIVWSLAAVAGLSLSLASVRADEPADPVNKAAEQFKTTINAEVEKLKADKKPPQVPPATREKLAKEALKDIKIETLNFDQITTLRRSNVIAAAGPEVMTATASRLLTLTKASEKEQGKIGMYTLTMLGSLTPAQQNELFTTLFAAKDLNEALAQGTSPAALVNAAMSSAASKQGANIIKLANMTAEPLSDASAQALTQVVSRLADHTEVAQREPLRARLVAYYTTAKAKVQEGDNKAAGQIDRDLKTLESKIVKEGLLNKPAPEIEFTWTTPGLESAKKLSDLKGKVVVVDFWATWCGPCVGSFPNIHHLQEHYANSPVVILGVTSIQGNHCIWKDGKVVERVDTKGNPEKETGLMPEFMKTMNMNWQVAFGKSNVFNPDYGVNGIPHVAIIDAKGIVRYRGLHPGAVKFEDKVNMIDGLLKEAGLPTPAGNSTPTTKPEKKPGA